MANEGEQVLPTYSDNGVRGEKVIQVADVHKTLFSVGEECDQNQWVIFTRRGGVIYSLETGAARPFGRQADGQYVHSIWLPPPGSEESRLVQGPGFARHGR